MRRNAFDKGTTAERRPLWGQPVVQVAAVVCAVAVLVGFLAARAPADADPQAPVGSPAPSVSATATPGGPPGHDHHPGKDGPPAEAWAVTVMFLDGIRATHAEERARILQVTATEEYAGLVGNIAEWKLPRGTVESIEPVAGHTFRVVLRAENLHGGGWASQPWNVTLVTDPFSPLEWRVSQFAQDHTTED